MPDDQASALRAAAQARPEPTPLPALAIAGGKGGVGKTCIAVNLGLLLAEMGLKPLLVDCDLGLANADVMLGLAPTATLHDVMFGGTAIGAALLHVPGGMSFIPAASGRDELTRLTETDLRKLEEELRRAAIGHDAVLLDLAAGIHRETMHLLGRCRAALVVVTPDPTSLTDAYAQIKVLHRVKPDADLRVVVNQASSAEEGVATYNRLRKVVQTYLDRDLAFLGQVPQDRGVREAVRRREPYARQGALPATQALRGVALRLRAELFAAKPASGAAPQPDQRAS
jgi:flagellar biosynthesis protein FlhG